MILLHRLHAHNFKHLRDVTLSFPESGTVLIEGENEAGKSSLFEAVFFALYGDSLISDQFFHLTDLKGYGADQLHVELDFSVEGKRFLVERQVRQNQTAKLICPAADGATETLRTLRAIRDRIREELRLSPNALLNTCFVEQKKLDQLESLNPAERARTINELLNLKVFSLMEAEFKITPEDRQKLEQAKERMVAARLDADLPLLQVAGAEATRRLNYSELLGVTGEICLLSERIDTAGGELATTRRLRKEIAGEIACYEQLKARQNDLDTNLTLRAHTWKDALDRLAQASERVRELETIASGLPDREARLRELHRLREQLAHVESLEAEGAALDLRADTLEDEQRRRGALEAEWERGEKERRRLEVEEQASIAGLAAAEGVLKQRVDARQAYDKLLAFLERLDDLGSKEADTRLQGERIGAARDRAGRLPALRQRLVQLQGLEQQLRQWQQDRETLTKKREVLTSALGSRADHHRRLEEIARLEGELNRQEREIRTIREQEAAASDRFRKAQTADALEAWAEAIEFIRDVESAGERLSELKRRREVEEEKHHEVDTAAKRQLGRRALAVSMAFLGLIGAGLGLANGVMAILLIGLVLAIGGGIAGAMAHRAGSSARAAAARLRSSADTLLGEERAVAQTLGGGADETRWRARRAEREATLGSFGFSLPSAPDEARKFAADRPKETTQQLEAILRAVQQRLGASENTAHLTREQLRREREIASATDLTTLDQEISGHQSEVRRLETALESAEDLPAHLQEWDLPEDGMGLDLKLVAAHQEVASAEAAAKSLSELDQELQARTEGVQEVLQRAESLSGELGLSGKDPSDWRREAGAEIQAFEEGERVFNDSALQEQVDQSREDLKGVRDSLSRLTAIQEGHRAALDARTFSALEADRAALGREMEENELNRQSLAYVRPALTAEGLPDESGELKSHLSILTADLERDRNEAELLPHCHGRAETAQQEADQKRVALESAWRETLPGEPVPPNPSEALDRLPELHADLTRELKRIDTKTLQEEDGRAKQLEERLMGEIAALEQQSRDLGVRRTTLISAFMDPSIAPDIPAAEEKNCINIEELPIRFPELEGIDGNDLPRWAEELEKQREAVIKNRLAREQFATKPFIGASPLDLEEEREAHAVEDRRLRMRRRAGEILLRTRQSLVGRVMPMTLQYMRLLLPALTEGRYRDVEWDEAANQISVHDSRAGRSVRKRVFSGGARDQISLALRLAFALATLPGEHHVRPGWLFLDEPLSSFDRNRTQALVDLLTRGHLRDQFRQIFLISHSETFDPAQFDHRIRMADGCIVENTLPTKTII